MRLRKVSKTINNETPTSVEHPLTRRGKQQKLEGSPPFFVNFSCRLVPRNRTEKQAVAKKNDRNLAAGPIIAVPAIKLHYEPFQLSTRIRLSTPAIQAPRKPADCPRQHQHAVTSSGPKVEVQRQGMAPTTKRTDRSNQEHLSVPAPHAVKPSPEKAVALSDP